ARPARRPADRRHLVREGLHPLAHVGVPPVPRLAQHAGLGRRRPHGGMGLRDPRPRAVLVVGRALRADRPAGPAGARPDPHGGGCMKAVIMAGGEGTRLRPLTSNAPKPVRPLVNAPMMEHIVGLLKQHGFDEIVVTVAFMANHIRTYFGDGSDFGVRMVYATEETPL